jgi:catechol 2,3-dioxygenase
MTPQIAKLGHVALATPDLERSLWFFSDVVGLDEVERRDGVVYLRAWGDWEHHTLSLRDGPTGVDHIAWRTAAPDHVDAFARALSEAGTAVSWVEVDEEAGQGAAVRFTSPQGHPYEIYHDVEKPLAPPEVRSRLKSNVARPWRRGMSPRRLDHVNVAARDVEGGTRWLADSLGLKLRELIRPTGRPMVSSWMSVTSQVHDVALTRELAGRDGRLHHFAYWFDTRDDVMRAADIAVDAGLEIDLGPGMHGVSRGYFCYLRDPGSGHRLELFSGGYHIFDPDWEPIEWNEQELDAALVWWGPEYRPGSRPAMDDTTPCEGVPACG